MDHGDHGGMPGMNHGHMPSCSMNMVWNWQTTNICILTSSWIITTPLSLYISLTFIAFAGVLYEYLRLYIRRYDSRLARTSPTSALASTHRRRASLLLPTSSPSSGTSGGIGIGERRSASKRRSVSNSSREEGNGRGWVKELETTRRVQMWRSALYASSVAISFLLMLIGMTFNGWVIGAIVFGKYIYTYNVRTSFKGNRILTMLISFDAVV